MLHTHRHDGCAVIADVMVTSPAIVTVPLAILPHYHGDAAMRTGDRRHFHQPCPAKLRDAGRSAMIDHQFAECTAKAVSHCANTTSHWLVMAPVARARYSMPSAGSDPFTSTADV